MKLKFVFLLVILSFLNLNPANAQQLKGIDSMGKGYYIPTTPSMSLHSPDQYSGNLTRLKPEGKFRADNVSNYPNEIYLPNEMNPENYRIHSNYAKNTDACASCHSTHTAVGASLLQWFNIYYTCMACHDGTVSTTYDVQDGNIGDTGKPTFGGVFGVGNEESSSSHNVHGTVSIFSAPGGAEVDMAIANPNPDEAGNNASWVIEFGCESCHSPHGQGGNARILNANPNGVGWAIYNSGASQNVELKWDSMQRIYYTDYNNDGEKDFWIKGYPYSKITVIYGVDDGGNIIDAKADGPLSPENTVEPDPIDSAYYAVYNGNGDYTEISLIINPGISEAGYRANFVPALKVKMNVINYLKDNEDVEHLSGMNAFCGACHTDYNTENIKKEISKTEPNGSAQILNGNYTEAYRHQVGMKSSSSVDSESLTKLKQLGLKFESEEVVTCQTCHLAHGTNSDFWKRTIGTTNNSLPPQIQFSDNQISEQTGSSALKRLPNMGTCEGCHNKGEAQEGYARNSGLAGTVEGVPGTNNSLFTQATAQYKDDLDYKCQACHPKQYQSFMATEHVTTGMVYCSNCHWPTSNHLIVPSSTNITTPTLKSASDFLSKPNWYNYDPTDPGWNTICWFCHDSWYGSQAEEFKMSSHYSSGLLDCFTCHPAHKTIQRTPDQLCSVCHEKNYNVPSLMQQSGHVFESPSTSQSIQTQTSGYQHNPDAKNCNQCHELRSNKIK